MNARTIAGPTKRALRPWLVRYRHIGLRTDDALLASFPRSGSTWLRFMLHGSMTGRDVDWSVVDAAIPYVGRQRNAARFLARGGRLLQTHELFCGRPGRVIYLVRDARAVLPSYYRQQKRIGYPGDFEAFVADFIAGRIEPFGSWPDHVRFWLGPDLTPPDDVLLVRFETLRSDPVTELRRILAFLRIDVSGSRVAAAIRENDLAAMKRKERDAPEGIIRNRREDLPFVASGAAESWKDLDPRHIARVEASAEAVLERLGYQLTR